VTAPTVLEMQQALAGKVREITDLEAFSYVPDSPPLPCAFLPLPAIDYDQAMGRGLDSYDFELYLFVSTVLDETSNEMLAAFADPASSTSIKKTLEADRRCNGGTAFGGLVEDFTVTTFRRLGREDLGGYEGLGGLWTIRLYAKGA
jgi:hypothetical protein